MIVAKLSHPVADTGPTNTEQNEVFLLYANCLLRFALNNLLVLLVKCIFNVQEKFWYVHYDHSNIWLASWDTAKA